MNKFCKSFEHESWAPLGLGGEPEESESGFSWGYADLLDAAGSGVVVIWAHGLPFAPGVLRRERAGEPVLARSAPCLSIAAYEKGNPVFYLLRDISLGDVGPESFGGVTIRRGEGTLELTFDVSIPGGEPLRGDLAIEGVDVSLPASGAAEHRWAPQLIGRGRADLRAGGWSLKMEGRGYHDRNASSRGLSELGIRRWIWGRTPHPDGEIVHYLLEPDHDAPEQNHVLNIGWDGTVDHHFVEVRRGPDARGRWGLRSPGVFDVGGLKVEHVSALEDGPFYQRWTTRVTREDGGVHLGVGEVVDVPRIDRGWFTPLTDMALDGARASIWVPLFAGPYRGRVARLFRYWRTRGAPPS